MKGPRAVSCTLMIGFVLGGLISSIGCGTHPEEGTLKLKPRQREAPEVAKPSPTKSLPSGKKNRKAAEEMPVGK